MKKFLKIIGIIAAVIVVLLIVLLILAKILITPERVKQTLIPIAEKALNRKVELQDVEVSIFSGIMLKGLLIREREGTEAFVAADQVKLKYQFWPLLSRRVVVDEVVLAGPEIRVVKLADGTFNFTDLTKKEKKPEPPPEKPVEKGPGINLLVSKVALTDGKVIYEDQSKKPPFKYTVSGIGFSASDISLVKPFPFRAEANLVGAQVKAEGTADLSEKQSIDVTVRVADAELRKMMAGVPADVAAKAKPFDPAGTVNVTLKLSGPLAAPNELLKGGEVKLSNVQVTAGGQRPSLNGNINIGKDSAGSENLVLALGQNKINITFKASNLLAKPIVVTSSISSDKFDLDPFLKKEKGAAAKEEPAAAKGAPASAKPEPGPLKLPVKATGSIRIGQTAYKGLAINDFIVKYRLADNVLTVEELRGKVAGGTFSIPARVNLGEKGFSYSTKAALNGVQADPVVSAFVPKAAGTIFGTLALTADLQGRGTQPDTIKKNLAGQGNFAITDGRITGAGFAQGLAQFLNVEELRVLRFSKFAGTFRIENGKIVLDSNVSGSDVRLRPAGTIGLDQSLDLSLEARLSPQLTKKVAGGDIRQFLTDDQGWGVMPLKVTGTTSSPKFRLDTSAVKGKAKEKLQQKFEEKIFKRKEGEPKRPEQELLERGLKGIFGR